MIFAPQNVQRGRRSIRTFNKRKQQSLPCAPAVCLYARQLLFLLHILGQKKTASPRPPSRNSSAHSSPRNPSSSLRRIQISHPFPHETRASVPEEIFPQVDRLSGEGYKACGTSVAHVRARSGLQINVHIVTLILPKLPCRDRRRDKIMDGLSVQGHRMRIIGGGGFPRPGRRHSSLLQQSSNRKSRGDRHP